MTQVYRLVVLMLPAVNDFAWRNSIKAAAEARGWAHHENWAAETPALDQSRDTVIISIDPDAAGRFQPTDWTILTTSREEALAQSIAQYGLSDIAARIHSTSRFAAADRLAARGAVVFDAYSSRIELPGLGPVVLTGGVPRALPAAVVMAPQALPMSREPGRDIPLDLALFAYPGTRGSVRLGGPVDLTGRARIVVVGPGLDLLPGVWRVRLTVAVDNEGTLPTLLFEWGSGIDMTRYETTVDQPGLYEVELEATWVDRAPSQLLVSVIRPLFSGTLKIVEAAFQMTAVITTPAKAPPPAGIPPSPDTETTSANNRPGTALRQSRRPS